MIKSRYFVIPCILITVLSCQPADNQLNFADPQPTEIRLAAEWLAKHFSRTQNQLPFSFEYDGKASGDLLKTWDFHENSESTDGDRTRHHLTWTDPVSRFSVRCEVVEYHDFPTLEWTLWFTNQGSGDTGILSNIQALSTSFPIESGAISVLRYINGDNDSPTSYALHTDTLSAGKALRFAPPRGRPTRDVFPYYNLNQGDQGVIAVIGWPGQWASEFIQHTSDSVRITGGQQNTSLKVKPGEEFRSPLIVLQFYKGDWIRSQNIWRRWMVKHNMPDYKDKPLKPMVSACNGNHYPGIITNAAEELKFMNRYLDEGILSRVPCALNSRWP